MVRPSGPLARPGSGSRSRPRSTAMTAAPVRLGWPSLARMCSTWVETVRGLATRQVPISVLENPAVSSVSTSSSRVVSR